MKPGINLIDGTIVLLIGVAIGVAAMLLREPTPITKYNAAVEYGWRCAKDGSTLKQALDEMKRP